MTTSVEQLDSPTPDPKISKETASLVEEDPIERDASRTDYLLTDRTTHVRATTMNNNETYEKSRPLAQSASTSNERAHGDDQSARASDEHGKPSDDPAIHFVEHSSVHGTNEGDLSVSSHFGISVPPASSSLDDFSSEMPMPVTDTSNEALKTDEENGMNKPYSSASRLHYPSEENQLNFSDYSLQPKLPEDECEYEIDLGNGSITKSTSSYRPDDKQQRTISVISADSAQVTQASHLPFTNPFYDRHHRTKQNSVNKAHHEANVLFSADDLIPEKRRAKWSISTIVIVSASVTIIALTTVLVLLLL